MEAAAADPRRPDSSPTAGATQIPWTGSRRAAAREAKALLAAEEGVAEIVGFVMVFGIIGVIILVSTLAFANQRQGVDQRVAELRAQSVAQRVAQVVYDVGLTAGTTNDLRGYNRTIELPSTLEGFGYTVNLVNVTTTSSCTPAQPCWRVNVTVSGVRAFAEESVANVGVGQANFELCTQAVSGGTVRVRYGPVYTAPAACQPAGYTESCRGVRTVADAFTAAGSNILKSTATTTFSIQDVGKTLVASPTIPVGTTITAFTNNKQVTMSANAIASVNPLSVQVGVTDPAGCFRLYLESTA